MTTTNDPRTTAEPGGDENERRLRTDERYVWWESETKIRNPLQEYLANGGELPAKPKPKKGLARRLVDWLSGEDT